MSNHGQVRSLYFVYFTSNRMRLSNNSYDLLKQSCEQVLLNTPSSTVMLVIKYIVRVACSVRAARGQ